MGVLPDVAHRNEHSVPGGADPPRLAGVGRGTSMPVDDTVRFMMDKTLANDGPTWYDVERMPADSAVRALFEEFSIGSQLTVALYPKGDEPRALGIHHCGARRSYEDELFQAVGNRLADGLTTFRAMQELSESEARFRTLVERAPDAIVVVDVESGVYVDANENAARLYETTVDELVMNYGPVYLSPEYQPDARRSADAAAEQLALALDGDFPKFEWTHITVNGEPIPCEVVLARLPHPTKKLIRGNITDIRARLAAERDRKDLEARLAQAQKMEAIGQLTGGIAHDFNNILTVILGNLELPGDFGEPVEVMKEQIAQAHAAAVKGSDLTHRLLAFARRQPLRPQSLDVGELLTGMDSMLRRTLGERVAIEMQIAPNLWSCEVDESQLEQALLNLAINARDAMPGSGRLTFRVSNRTLGQRDRSQPEGDFMIIEVSDDGSGMGPDVLPHIFTPFFTTKDVGKGTGLGLSMVYGFVHQSGGHVEARSVVDEGLAISVYLPRTTGPVVREAARSRIDAAAGGHGERILVVEDEAPVRRLTVAMLAGLGYAVSEARDASDALEVLRDSKEIELLLTDMVLPGPLNGPALAAAAAVENPRLRVLYMSGYPRDAKLTGENALLEKPFTREQLASRIQDSLRYACDG